MREGDEGGSAERSDTNESLAHHCDSLARSSLSIMPCRRCWLKCKARSKRSALPSQTGTGEGEEEAGAGRDENVEGEGGHACDPSHSPTALPVCLPATVSRRSLPDSSMRT